MTTTSAAAHASSTGESSSRSAQRPTKLKLTYVLVGQICELKRDKEGNWIDDIPGGNDHSIDAVRYPMMDDVLRG